jgi:hypothetical protein
MQDYLYIAIIVPLIISLDQGPPNWLTKLVKLYFVKVQFIKYYSKKSGKLKSCCKFLPLTKMLADSFASFVWLLGK